MPSSRRTPAARQGSAGGINPAPTGKFCVSGKPGATMFAPVCRGGPRPSRGEGSAAGQPGRYRIGPYMGCLRRRGMFPVLNRQRCGGVNARPTEPGKHGGHPGNTIPAAVANPCRGRCSHCARRRVSEANRTAGPALRPEIVPGCLRRRRVRGRDKSRPYGQILCFRQIGGAAMFAPVCRGHGPPGGGHGRAGRADMESAPTWGVCGGAGFPGRCEHRPLHTFAIMQGPRFPARRGHRRRS